MALRHRLSPGVACAGKVEESRASVPPGSDVVKMRADARSIVGRRIAAEARQAIEEADAVYVSAASAWEAPSRPRSAGSARLAR
jgi:hypothetical protein